MEAILNEQLDMFEGKLMPEFIQAEKIRLIEESQEKLRRGIFRRWNEQEKKIQTLSEYVETLSNVLKNAGELNEY